MYTLKYVYFDTLAQQIAEEAIQRINQFDPFADGLKWML
jgi:hypothetical protein